MDNNRNLYVFVSGPPYSGKDTSVDRMIERRGIAGVPAIKMAFSGAMKRSMLDSIGLTGYNITDFDDDKDKPRKEFNSLSFRQACILYSEKYMKPMKGKDVFGKIVAEQIKHFVTRQRVIIITGAGFIEEVEPVLKDVDPKDVLHIIMHKKDCHYDNDSRRDIHIPGAKRVGLFNDSTIEEIQDVVERVISEHVHSRY